MLDRLPQTMFSGQNYMDFAFADLVQHFNDGKRHAGILSQMGLDVSIHSHIYYWANDTRKICASAKKKLGKQKKIRQSKRVQRKDHEDNYTFVEGSIYSVEGGG